MSLNNVCLVGRVVKKPDMRNLKTGAKIATFTLAINRPTKDNDEVDFIDCQAWGRTAEICREYMEKGTLAGLTGYLRKETWEKDGEKRSRIMVVLNTVRLLGTKKPDTADEKQNSAMTSQESGEQLDFFGAEQEVNLG